MIEEKRGCGYRHVGGLYLVGGAFSVPCDRLPLPLTVCPVCGQGIKVGRGFTEINAFRLWGNHEPCLDPIRPCFLCDPKDQPAYIMGVGAKYYPKIDDFMEEAGRLGVSKRIPFIPKGLVLGETVVFLSHPTACEVKESAVMQQAMSLLGEGETQKPRLLESEKVTKCPGIFTAFIPQRVEKLIWENQATPEELEKLQKRNITPVVIPNGDEDHA